MSESVKSEDFKTKVMAHLAIMLNSIRSINKEAKVSFALAIIGDSGNSEYYDEVTSFAEFDSKCDIDEVLISRIAIEDHVMDRYFSLMSEDQQEESTKEFSQLN